MANWLLKLDGASWFDRVGFDVGSRVRTGRAGMRWVKPNPSQSEVN